MYESTVFALTIGGRAPKIKIEQGRPLLLRAILTLLYCFAFFAALGSILAACIGGRPNRILRSLLLSAIAVAVAAWSIAEMVGLIVGAPTPRLDRAILPLLALAPFVAAHLTLSLITPGAGSRTWIVIAIYTAPLLRILMFAGGGEPSEQDLFQEKRGSVIVRSADDGHSWETVWEGGLGGPIAERLIPAPQNTESFYAFAFTPPPSDGRPRETPESLLLVSQDAATSFVPTDEPLPPHIETPPPMPPPEWGVAPEEIIDVRATSASSEGAPRQGRALGGRRLIAGTHRRGLLISHPDTGEWETAEFGGSVAAVAAVVPTGSDGPVLTFGHSGVYSYAPESETWTRLASKIGFGEQPAWFTAGALHPYTRRKIAAGTGSPMRVVVSEDGGRSWTSVWSYERSPEAGDLPGGDVTSVAWSADGKTLYATTANVACTTRYDPPITGAGVLISHTGGRTWLRPRLVGRPLLEVAAHPTDDNRAIVAADDGLLLTVDTGETWERVLTTRDPVRSVGFAETSRHAVCVTSRGQVWGSVDDGLNWEMMGEVEGVCSVTSVALLDQAGGSLVIGDYEQGMFVSRTGGETWTRIPAAVPPRVVDLQYRREAETIYVATTGRGLLQTSATTKALQSCSGPAGGTVVRVRLWGEDPQRVITLSIDGWLLMSDDGGASWRRAAIGAAEESVCVDEGVPRAPTFRSIAVHPQDVSHIVAGTEWSGELFETRDGGRSWTRRALPQRDAYDGVTVTDLAYGRNSLLVAALEVVVASPYLQRPLRFLPGYSVANAAVFGFHVTVLLGAVASLVAAASGLAARAAGGCASRPAGVAARLMLLLTPLLSGGLLVEFLSRDTLVVGDHTVSQACVIALSAAVLLAIRHAEARRNRALAAIPFLHSIRAPVLTTDFERNIVNANAATAKLFPHVDSLTGKRLDELVRRTDRNDHQLGFDRTIRRSRSFPAVVVTPQVEEPMCLLTYSLYGGMNGEAGGYIVTITPESAIHQAGRHLGLTTRECEVARHLLRGASYKEIAWELHISPATVRTHVHRIYDKTDTANKIQLMELVRSVDPPANGESA